MRLSKTLEQCKRFHYLMLQQLQGQQLPEDVKVEFQPFDWSVNWENNARANLLPPASPAR